MNSVKLANCKSQLEKKKQKLEDLEASSTNTIVKFFKRHSLKKEIRDLEAEIEELEKQLKTDKEESK